MGADDVSVSRGTGSRDDFWVSRDAVSSMIFYSNVVFGRGRFQRHPWNSVPVMIYGSGGTQFSSMIYESDIVYGC